MPPDPVFAPVLSGLLGMLIGSFLNVCIYRLPRDLSVIRPRSHCPECQKTISAWDNIPVISFLLLRGKCRHCGARISVRYLLVELITGMAFAWFVARDGWGLLATRDCMLICLLLALLFTDLETRLLPEELTLGGIALGLIFSWFVPVGGGFASLFGFTGRAVSVGDSVLGILIPAAPLWLLGWVFEKIRHKQGLGFGDVVMIAAIGAFLGVQMALFTLVAASVSGSVIGLIYLWATKRDMATYELPLGSLIGVAGIAVLAFGKPLVGWYMGLSS